MKSYLTIICVFVLALSSCSDDSNPIVPPPFPEPTNLDEALTNLFQPLIDNDTTVGAAVGIIHGDNEYMYYFGERKRGSGIKPDDNTSFEIASITKTFTATLLADMVVRGELTLSDVVADDLPVLTSFPAYQGQQITYMHLANHTSGLPRLDPNHFLYPDIEGNNPYKAYSKERMYTFLSKYQLPRPVGALEEYSNLGFGLLGHVLAERRNTTYAALLQERVLAPLGMNSSSLGPNVEGVTPADVYDFALKPTPRWTYPDHQAGLGAIRATLPDMMRYLKANMGLMANNPLQPAMDLAQTITSSLNAPAHTGLAWTIFDRDADTRLMVHNGGHNGSATLLVFNKAINTGAIILFNTNVRGPLANITVDARKMDGIFDAIREFD